MVVLRMAPALPHRVLPLMLALVEQLLFMLPITVLNLIQLVRVLSALQERQLQQLVITAFV